MRYAFIVSYERIRKENGFLKLHLSRIIRHFGYFIKWLTLDKKDTSGDAFKLGGLISALHSFV
jgi:hypothetical protein